MVQRKHKEVHPRLTLVSAPLFGLVSCSPVFTETPLALELMGHQVGKPQPEQSLHKTCSLQEAFRGHRFISLSGSKLFHRMLLSGRWGCRGDREFSTREHEEIQKRQLLFPAWQMLKLHESWRSGGKRDTLHLRRSRRVKQSHSADSLNHLHPHRCQLS